MENGMAERGEGTPRQQNGSDKRLRGFGVLMLCILLAAAGFWKFSPEVMSASSRVDGKEVPICSVERMDQRIALSFECVEESGNTQEILEILKQQQVEATFFVSRQWAEGFPKEVRRIVTSGHEIGSYGNGMGSMEQLSRTAYRDCLEAVGKQVRDLTGVGIELFRPPLGRYDNEILNMARKEGYIPVCWSVDSMDWKDYGTESIVKAVCENPKLQSGAIVRFQNDARYTAQALESVISELKQRGFQMVPVGALIYREGFRMDDAGKQLKT